MQHSSSYIQIFIWFLLGIVFSPIDADAQSDTTAAKFRQNELLKECRLGFHVRGSKKYMDELFSVSGTLHDTPRQTMALQYILLHYIHFKENIDTIREFTDSVKSFSLKTGSKYSYYFCWSQYIQHLIASDTTLRSGKVELERMMQEVLEDNHVYGQIQCYRRFMAYYERLHIWDVALANNAEAISITEQRDPENRNLCMYYLDHAHVLRMLKRYPEAYDYIRKAMDSHTEKMHKIQILASQCQLDAETGNYSSIVNIYNDCMNDEELLQAGHNTTDLLKIRFYYYSAVGDYNKAMQVIKEYEANFKEPLQTSRFKAYLAADVTEKMMEKNNSIPSLNVKKAMLDYVWAVDSINNNISRMMGDESINNLNTSIIMRQEEEANKAESVRHRFFAIIFLSVSSVLLVVLSALFYRSRRKIRKLAQQTGDVAKKNIKLKQINEELQGNINSLSNSYQEAQAQISDINRDSKMKTAFIYSLARELRNVAVNGLDKASTSQLLEYAKNMEILQNLATRERITVEEFNLNDVCNGVFNKYIAENPPSKDVKFYYEPTAEEKPMVNANIELLTLIICNLLRLSQKHTTHGEIILKTRRNQAGHLQMIVTDTGGGIPKAKRDQMFDRLSDFEDSDTGTILNLAICRVAAHSQNCRIWLDTNLYSISGTSIVVEF